MKKLLIASLVLVLAGASYVYAADNTTYSGRMINKYTQKITDKEKQLQQQQKAREEASAKKQAEYQKKLDEQKKAYEAKKKANEEAAKARQQKIEHKKKLFNELISD